MGQISFHKPATPHTQTLAAKFFWTDTAIMRILYLLGLTLVIGCNGSKWEKIKGTGIDKESKSLDPI